MWLSYTKRPTVQVRLSQEIGERLIAAASFRIAPFSNFDFSTSKVNQNGRPSSRAFSSGLACAGISNFKRTNHDVSHA